VPARALRIANRLVAVLPAFVWVMGPATRAKPVDLAVVVPASGA
jgi:hypothetical protein